MTHGDFDGYGGRYVPEALESALKQLATAYDDISASDDFQAEFRGLLETYAGRATPLYHARNLSERYGADIYLKREDLLHGGAHKINNALGQALLAKKAGKDRLIAETGAGQHGTATAMVGALFNLDTEIYMGKKDVERQQMNVFRMRLMGAEVNEVTRGGSGLADAVDAALEDFAKNIDETHYLVGSVVGPDPFPRMVRDFQSVIGEEAREQFLDRTGELPDAAVACVGGGSNAIGLFHAFRDDNVSFYGAEGGGKGPDSKQHAAPLAKGKDDVIHGMKTRVIDDDVEVHSVSAGLDYPGVGPEHAMFRALGRAEYTGVTDDEALAAFRELSETEGIIPALESSHAVARAIQLAETSEHDTILVNLSGRGDKDMETAAERFSL
ncbi:tryptophan synthase subunit beta (plasmid) [Haloferax mediterranei ATCC 33500]|uniref:Tryptophan synthase beta chain n=1 Tax=Haloferax mediterranei (strain ATCC 33500 / DSM 1411 / JCM 8866 / NBRC 14739 / NCIMB 2177 / R-4) TaxID=523841 RepID=I3RB57_HALMT|nr:tryptophan synthase subunit beta [Haloferax mediterranei]AFK21467.1 tryptophan synthase subunit beta [Haloferax mediterranei ATCC 33500]AHZ24469.1 tryptophan synthase subunit beta [Haloferax mediterranei ATCC 33500]ELZ97216.1 tryptophan synthase subunit beta [Haloferax mediterranei ATCC 33500]MDX5990046.1 tryptophan synthase subunit beta [Haloferax mediterranei ATCC 33500]QCQ76867.1 tryptophan synthase subunit beta [Haloferax mediterranei ATCC 33500]